MRATLLCPSRGNTPYDSDDGITPLQDQVLDLLEDAGIPPKVNDQIMAIIARAEREIASTEHPGI